MKDDVNDMASQRKNTLAALLDDHPDLASRAKDRNGLAEIASLLLQLRHELNLSQRDLADRSGLSKTMISELENSANDGVTLRTLVRIARGAGASLNLGLQVDPAMAGCVTGSLHTGHYDFAEKAGTMRVVTTTEPRTAELAA
ncbi:MAG: helix-turn-helix transcriptional regulator [Candidatus Eremiobacteraeota bacterium]|nr:helix-turn-helix transcriptional regulator [Candidatus Eremiobacteraeota bacterium]MBC5801715.1 helix-turn-helix transcriptional regulator [Candidatus Eremiobacteraeota bacterium]MBC5822135.1 helix-turn-helix transcriptional regulator [Candidatus Eremiobacteraeota bacterium]